MEEPGCFDSVEYISLEQWDDIQEGKINSSILGCDPEDRYPHPPCDKVYILPSDDSKQAYCYIRKSLMNAIKSTGRLPFPNYELTDNSIEKLEDVTWGNIFILKKYGYRYRLVDSPRGFVGVVVNITEWMPVFSEDLFDSPHTKPMFTVIEASGQEHHFIKYESDKWIYETLDDSSEITREIMIIQLVDLMTNRRLLRLMFSIFIPKALYTFPGLRGRLWRFESYRDVDIYRYSIEFT